MRVPARTIGARTVASVPNSATGPAGGYTPADIAAAYEIDPDTETSQVVGIVDAFDNPNALRDLTKFDRRYGLPRETATSFTKFSQAGSTTDLPAPNAVWAGEIALDLQAVRGLCHRCHIILVEADSDSDADLSVAENEAVVLGATVISNSFGEPESGPIPETVSRAFNHPGVVVVAGAGDDGMYSWDAYNSGGASADAPLFPASLSTVVAAGGTTLLLDDDGTRSDEYVWNENGEDDLVGASFGFALGATGGGCSTVTRAPKWQTQVPGWRSTTCRTRRLPADIAALADPFTGFDVYNSYQSSGWQTVGGTSLSAPLVAAMWAMAGGSGAVRYPAQTLYRNLESQGSGAFFDVVSGGNGFCGGDSAASCSEFWGQSPNTFGAGILDCAFLPNSERHSAGTRACDAAPGYDGPSGVGVPRGLAGFSAVAGVDGRVSRSRAI